MPRAYSLDLRQGLIDAVEAGSSARAAARRLQVCTSTGFKRAQRKRQTGGVEAKPMHGHPPARLALHKERLLRLVAEEPDLTVKQIDIALIRLQEAASLIRSAAERTINGLQNSIGSASKNSPKPNAPTTSSMPGMRRTDQKRS